MTFALIDTDGTLTIRPESVTRDSISAVMPGGYWDMVRLHKYPDLFGFVDDAGHISGLPRNPLGALLLAYLGANARGNPYAGPVAITGWEEPSNGSEFRDLTPGQVQYLTVRHGQLSDVLAGGVQWFSPEHRAEMLAYAEFVRTAPAPGMTMMTLDEYMGGVS